MTQDQGSTQPEHALPQEARGSAPGRGRLVGRHVLVVGAGTRRSDDPDAPIGNGRAIAVLAAREGAKVACADLNEDAARETLEQVEKNEALSRHCAREGARQGVRSNVVVLGLMDTPLGRLASQGRPSRSRTRVPLGRQGTGWEAAYAALFLLSDEASYVTGETLVIDGGLSTVG